MNKKYMLRITVLSFFITNASSYAMSKTQAFAMGTFSYITYRIITNHRESKKSDHYHQRQNYGRVKTWKKMA